LQGKIGFFFNDLIIRAYQGACSIDFRHGVEMLEILDWQWIWQNHDVLALVLAKAKLLTFKNHGGTVILSNALCIWTFVFWMA